MAFPFRKLTCIVESPDSSHGPTCLVMVEYHWKKKKEKEKSPERLQTWLPFQINSRGLDLHDWWPILRRHGIHTLHTPWS